jgi:hypothetical protein
MTERRRFKVWACGCFKRRGANITLKKIVIGIATYLLFMSPVILIVAMLSIAMLFGLGDR